MKRECEFQGVYFLRLSGRLLVRTLWVPGLERLLVPDSALGGSGCFRKVLFTSSSWRTEHNLLHQKYALQRGEVLTDCLQYSWGKMHRTDLPWVYYLDVLFIKNKWPIWQVSVCTFVSFLFLLVLKQKSSLLQGPSIHSCSGLQKFISDIRGIFLFQFYFIHMGFLLSFLWLNQFNTFSDIMRGGVSLFPCDRKSVLKTSDAVSPLPFPSHWSSGLSSAGHSCGKSENSRQHYPLELFVFWELWLDSKDQNFAFCLPSTCISEKQEFWLHRGCLLDSAPGPRETFWNFNWLRGI